MKLNLQFFLLLLITGFALVSSPFLTHLKEEIKKEIQLEIYSDQFNDDDLHRFSQDDLANARWLDSKEFILNNTLYDLVKIKILNGEKVYHCFKDKKETRISSIETDIQNRFTANQLSRKCGKPKLNIRPKLKFIALKTPYENLSRQSFELFLPEPETFKAELNFSEFIESKTIPPEI